MTATHKAPSPWIVRFAPLIGTGGTVLDVACGSGRHTRFLAAAGHRVLAVDRDRDGLQALRGVDAVQAVCADLETDGLPTASRFAAVVVTDYLWRPLLPGLLAAVGPGGVLLYETFMDGQQTIGRPRRPEFLLEPDELARCTSPLSIVAFEQGLDLLTGNFRQRIVAVRLPAGTSKIPAALRQDD